MSYAHLSGSLYMTTYTKTLFFTGSKILIIDLLLKELNVTYLWPSEQGKDASREIQF